MRIVREEFFGKDPKVLRAINIAASIVNNSNPILIIGEAGVGKESLGIYIHEESNRKNNEYMVVDCARNDRSVEDEILGHRDEISGRFNKGILEKANGGTIILRNVDGMTESFQKKIHKIFLELNDYDIDLRVIATTTKNISKLVGAGRFSRALYLYISETQISLPPLRERKEDIDWLAKNFLVEAASEHDLPVPELTIEALDKLLNYYWSLNIAELKSVIHASIKNAHDGILGLEDLCIGERRMINAGPEGDEDGIKLMSLKEAEKLLIKKALIHTSENRTQAAKILGVSIRTLRNKINEYRNDGSNYFINLR